MKKHGWFWTIAMVAALGLTCNEAQAGRWISQSKYIALAPIDNPAGCGVLTEADMLAQFAGVKAAFLAVDPTPMVGDAWPGLPYREGSGRWDNYGCRGDGDVVDFNLYYGQNDFVVGIVITYATNTTGVDIPVNVCFASDDAGLVAINDDVVLSVDACRGTAGDCDVPGRLPGVLKPGLNRILAAAWEEGGGWSLRLALERLADGSQIDDDTAADVVFHNRPDMTQDLFCGAARSISYNCPMTGSETVGIKGSGTPPNPADTFSVTESIRGNVTVSDITGGGVFTPAGQTVNDAALCGAGNPQGLLEDSIDLGAGVIKAGSTAYDMATGVYTVNGAGRDIHGGADFAHFAYKRITGDFDIKVKVDSVRANAEDLGYAATAETVDRWGRFGLMAREDCDQSSRQVMCNQPSKDDRGNLDPADDTFFEFAGHLRRETKGGGTSTGQGNDYYTNEGDNHVPFNGQMPAYMRLTRVGNNFCTYTSQNGTDWVFQVCDDWGDGAPATVRAGLVVSSHLDNALIEVKFSNLTIETSAASTRGGRINWPAKTFDMVDYSYKVSGLGRVFLSGNLANATTDISVGGRRDAFLQAAKTSGIGQFSYARDLGPNRDNYIDHGGSTKYDEATQTYTQVGTGNDLWWQGDTGQWAYRTVPGDFDVAIEVTNRVRPGGGDQHGRFGLMSRIDCQDFSAYAGLFEHISGSAARVPMLTQIRPAAFHLGSFDGNTDDGLMRANSPPDDHPNFQRMVRQGNTVYTFFSRDGVDWHAHGAEPMVLQGGPSIPLDVGVVNGAHGSHRRNRPERSFKILHFNEGPLTLPSPVHDDGIDPGEELYSNPFDDAADLVFNKRESFLPLVIDGELKLLAENDGGDATTALVQAHTLDSIDSGDKYAFDFDIRFQGGGGNPADGVVFVIMGGTDFTRVGGGGGGMGYYALNRSIPGDNSIDTPSVGVEFDNWAGGGYNEGWGSTSTGAAGEWHTGIIPTGTLTAEIQTSGTAEDPLPDIYSQYGIHARVTYSAGNVEVWLGQNTAEGPATELRKWVETRVLPLTYAQEEGFTCIYGFAGGTGGATVSAFIDNLSVKLVECNDIAEVAAITGTPAGDVTPGTVVNLDSTGSSAGAGDTGAITYKWSVTSGPGTIQGSDTGATVAINTTGAGDVNVSLVVDDGACANPATATATFKVKAAVNWVRCDGNGDNLRDLTDAVFSLNFQFLAGPPSQCPGALDCNKDGMLDLTDAVFDLNFQFLAGPPPAAPYPECDLFEGCGTHARCP